MPSRGPSPTWPTATRAARRMPRRRGPVVAVLVLAAGAVVASACSGDDGSAASGAVDASSSTASAQDDTGATDGTGGTDESESAATAAREQADSAGEPIVQDGTVEVPGPFGGTAVYEFRNVRLTAPVDATDCPGGRPVNAQRLVVDLTAYLVPPEAGDPNVEPDGDPAPIPYVSQLPEVVLTGVGEQDTANDRWFVGISPVSRLVQSVPNTYLRAAPDGPAGDCAILGWEPTDVPEPVLDTELLALSSGFVPADFDPADYQVRIGRGADFAYCWPLDRLSDAAELGQCR